MPDVWWGLAGLVFGLALMNRPNMAFGLAGDRRGVARHTSSPPTRRPRLWGRPRDDAGSRPQRGRFESAVSDVCICIVARRAELLHRQQRGGDGLLPSGAGDHAQHQGTIGRRTPCRGESHRPAGRRRGNIELFLRSGVGLDPANIRATRPGSSRASSATRSARITSPCLTAIRSTRMTSARCCASTRSGRGSSSRLVWSD